MFRCNLASLLTIALHGKLEYYTSIMKELLIDLIDASACKNPKLMLRRTESVVEKMLTNWMSICMYSYLKVCAPVHKSNLIPRGVLLEMLVMVASLALVNGCFSLPPSGDGRWAVLPAAVRHQTADQQGLDWRHHGEGALHAQRGVAPPWKHRSQTAGERHSWNHIHEGVVPASNNMF